jgi:hypothetical protein
LQVVPETIEKWLSSYLILDLAKIIRDFLGEHCIYDASFFESETNLNFAKYTGETVTEKDLREDNCHKWSFLNMNWFSRFSPSLFPSVQCLYLDYKFFTDLDATVATDRVLSFIENLPAVFMVLLDLSVLYYKPEINIVHPKIHFLCIEDSKKPFFYSVSITPSQWSKILQSKTVSNCDEVYLPNDIILSHPSRLCFASSFTDYLEMLNVCLAATYNCPNLVNFQFMISSCQFGLLHFNDMAARKVLPQLQSISVTHLYDSDYVDSNSLLSAAVHANKMVIVNLPSTFKGFRLPSSVTTLCIVKTFNDQKTHLKDFLHHLLSTTSHSVLSRLHLQISQFSTQLLLETLSDSALDWLAFHSISFLHNDWRPFAYCFTLKKDSLLVTTKKKELNLLFNQLKTRRLESDSSKTTIF